MAQPGGVLTRAGHTEAGCDLARLAGLEPAAVIVEILNDDGTMARRPELETFRAAARAQDRHDRGPDPLPAREGALGRAHRRARRSTPSSGRSGCICYEDHVNSTVHLALVRGELGPQTAPLVRVHLKDTIRDLVGAQETAHSWSLRGAMQRIAREGRASSCCCVRTRRPLEIAEAVRIA